MKRKGRQRQRPPGTPGFGGRLREFLHLPSIIVFIVATLFLWVVGSKTYHTIRASTSENLGQWMVSQVDAKSQRIRNALLYLRSVVHRIASDAELERLVGEIHERILASDEAPPDLVRAPEVAAIRRLLESKGADFEFSGFLVVDRDLKVIAASTSDRLGKFAHPGHYEAVHEALRGRAVVGRPLKDSAGQADSGRQRLPWIYISAPIRDAAYEPVAVLSMQLRPEVVFPKILSAGGENQKVDSYVFDSDRLILSETGGNDRPYFAVGPEPGVSAQGVNLRGYWNHHRKKVVGAWNWFPEYGLGVAAEVDTELAYKPIQALLKAFGILFGLVVISTFGVMLISFLLIVIRRRAQAELLKARQLGQYTLERRIGKGGMGEVYRAHHAMLRRPTAIKLIHRDHVNDRMLHQFEKEVQLTSRLTHPNTIAIYDYGHTPDNIFYYAMEYLTGFTLSQLVAIDGPQPAGRVIYILQRICASLQEAHAVGLIHRDVKPANVMLCRLGGMYDVVKVLDFGLVTEQTNGKARTDSSIFAGSLKFLAPEAISEPHKIETSVDVFSIGALAYYLLTGCYMFDAEDNIEYHRKMMSSDPVPMAERIATSLPTDLTAVVMAAVSRSPSDRPSSVRALAELLGACRDAGTWNSDLARDWWTKHSEKYQLTESEESFDTTGQSLFVDLDERYGSGK